MQFIDADRLESLLDFPRLVDRLDDAFRADITAPVRHHHNIEMADEANATLLLMPAWRTGHRIAVKVATVFPDNGKRGQPGVQAQVLLMDGTGGRPLALIDGARLTLWRTAAASALACRYVSREDSSRLTMIGTGSLAPYLIRAHASVRPIREIRIWGRNLENAQKLAAAVARDGIAAEAVEDRQEAVAWGDIVSTATLSKLPLVSGNWLQDGAHLDLVGGFTPEMREADNAAIHRSTIFVDTLGGATKEAGDIVQPIAEALINKGDITADLFALARGEVTWKRQDDEVTLFKSVGASLEDLAAAELVYELAN